MLRGALVVTAVIFASVPAMVAEGSPVAVRCSLWAAPTGADTNPGTKGSPFLSLDKLAKSLAPGQTGCLPPGATFGKREAITAGGKSGKGRITITTGPGGPRALLANGVETTQATRYLTLTNLDLTAANGPGPPDAPGTVVLRGYSTALTRSVVGPGSLKEQGRSCVVLDHARAAVVGGNVLHDCNGASPGQYGAGVLAEISAGARISDNVIYGNAGGDGIAFSPNAQFSVARRNLIVDNGGGIYFGGDTKTASRGNRVERNVIARSSNVVVHSGYASSGSPGGLGNVVRGNCIWGSGTPTAAGIGFAMSGNRKVNPRVVKRIGGGYRLSSSSPCKFTTGSHGATSANDILFG